MASGLQPLAATNLRHRLMELVYTFDPAKFHLGTLCKRQHNWPGRQQSLRRTYIDKNGKDCSGCVGCTASNPEHWLVPFIDRNHYGLPEHSRLGDVCKGGHLWQGQQLTLRVKGRCLECDQIRHKQRWRNMNSEQKELQKSRQRRRYRENAERLIDASRSRRAKMVEKMQADPVFAERVHKQRRERKERYRRRQGIPKMLSPEQRQLRDAIRNAGRQPTVARLVMDEQRRYWHENPSDFAVFDRERKRLYNQWRHMTDPNYRLYHRQKSKRRKAQMRNSTAHQLTGKEVQRRFAEFDHCCAYCGAKGDLHIEHVHPISKGGAHALSNIVPACQSCNYSKFTNEAEQWYRAQPFFTEKRWRAICAVTDAGLLPMPVQLGLALAC